MDFETLLHAPATLALLVTNIVVSIAAFSNERLVDAMMFDVGKMRRRNEWHRMITSGFIHADATHLFFNMLSLYFLGPFVERIMGTWTFLGVYMACLIAGSLWSFMDHFRDMNYRALGASGAVSGITTAAAMFAPLATILAFFILPMPLIVFALLYIGFSAWASRNARDGIGHSAHLGGALMGIALVCIFWPEAVRSTYEQFANLFRR